MRIAFLIPYYQQVPAMSHLSICRLFGKLVQTGIEFAHFDISSTYLPKARQALLDMFLEVHKRKPFDWTMWIDSDQVFKPEQFLTMLSHAQKRGFDMLSATYFVRTGHEVTPVMMMKNQGTYARLAELPDEPFFEVDVCGFGFLLVKPKVYLDILKKNDKPFSTEWIGDKFRGEDTAFCRLAQECGYKIVIDRNTTIGHAGGIMDFRTYMAWRAELELMEGQKR